ncbi:MAG: threonyl-tRNA synthetase [Methanobacteriota archaeon]|jgi:threonyl-tRNA synthetase
MKLLLIHSDYIEYEARDETPVAEDEPALEGRLEEALTAFIAVEEGDEEDVDGVVEGAVEEIVDVADELGVKGVMVYPYAHLSQDLASPETAVSALKRIAGALREGHGYEVQRAPFGWYKSFELSCKGHPMSELSRVVEPREVTADEEDEEDEEETEPSDYLVMTPDGEVHDAEGFRDEVDGDLRTLIDDEIGEGGGGEEGEEDAHIRMMRDKEFVGYDGLSDPGNFRWYPRGKCARDLLIDYVDDLVVDYGGMPVETPIMYDLGAPCIHEHSEKFGERQYRFESGDRKMMLRFAACFGQFSVMRDMHIASNDLPLRVYEMSKYSFRREQRGELSGLKRLRAFTMPDMHTACADMEEAQDEFRKQAVLGYRTGDDLGLDYTAALRTTRDYFDDHRGWFEDIADEIGEPVLVEVIPERKHYWSVKIDLAVTAGGEPMENPTVQIDVESADRFDIEYYDDEGEHEPVLLHYSPSGSIERAFAALLETAAEKKDADGETPSLPVWMSPTQVRFVPIGDEHTDHCAEVAETLSEAGIRADIDDRDETVGKKIRKAEQDWVPYIAVVGDEEVEDGTLSVRVREEGEERTETPQELVDEINERVKGMPTRERYTPLLLSDKPQFV